MPPTTSTPTPYQLPRGAERRLIEAMEPFRGLALASALQALFATGVYDELEHGEARPAALAEALHLDEERTIAVLQFLAVEDVVAFAPAGAVGLTPRGRAYGEFRAWYAMMVGGYANVLATLAESMAAGASPTARRGEWVALGSAGVDVHSSMTLIRRLVARLPAPPRLVLDVGCGSPRYLGAICAELGCRGIGVEPDPAAFEAGRRQLEGSDGTVRIVRGSAQDCIAALDIVPDVVLTAFVLHEVLGQSGEHGVRRYLRDVFAAAPAAHLLVIEPDLRQDDPSVMRHGYARAFYNGYYLVHPFTGQRLAPREYWEELFRSESLTVVAGGTTDPDIDSTGLELGWLLRAAPGQ